MENASKALLMAGGILIALLIIVVLLRTFGNVIFFQKAQLTEEEQAAIIQYNEQYTKYLGQYVYGTEIITLINKSASFGNLSVKLKLMGERNYIVPTVGSIEGLKTKAFKCTEVKYDTTGKINEIYFDEKQWGALN